MMIGRANLVAGTTEIVAKFPLHIRFDVRLAMSGAGKVNRRGGGLRALDALRMVMGDLGGKPRQMQHLLHVPSQPRRRRYPHGAAVAVAVIGLRRVLVKPTAEPYTVAPVGISAPQTLHFPHQRRFDDNVILPAGVHKRFRHRQSHNRIVGEFGLLAEQRKVFCFVIVAAEFIGAAYDIAENCPVHIYLPLFSTSSSMRRFQSALSGLAARTQHTASLMTS